MSPGPSADENGPRRLAVFLDRDGTLIHDRHYLADPEGVRLIPGVARAVARLNRAGIPVLVVTNQSGIGRGYFTESDYGAVQRRVVRLLAEAGAWLDGVYHCPHAPDLDPPCTCRKPRPGLFERAAHEHGIDLARSFFIGDNERDVVPAARWGATAILVRADAAVPNRETGSVYQARDLESAVDRVLGATPSD